MAYRLLSVIVFVLLSASQAGLAASEHRGQVTVGTVPVPGATITASQGDKRVVTSTDQDGVYKFADLADGAWTLKVDMIGFTPVSQDVTVAPDSPPAMWELKLRPFEEIAREVPANRVDPATATTTAAANGTPNAGARNVPPSTPAGGFQRAGVNVSSAPAAPAAPASAPA